MGERTETIKPLAKNIGLKSWKLWFGKTFLSTIPKAWAAKRKIGDFSFSKLKNFTLQKSPSTNSKLPAQCEKISPNFKATFWCTLIFLHLKASETRLWWRDCEYHSKMPVVDRILSWLAAFLLLEYKSLCHHLHLSAGKSDLLLTGGIWWKWSDNYISECITLYETPFSRLKRDFLLALKAQTAMLRRGPCDMKWTKPLGTEDLSLSPITRKWMLQTSTLGKEQPKTQMKSQSWTIGSAW